MQPSKKAAVLISMALIMVSGFGTNLYAPSLPHITQSLHTSATLVRISLSIFVLGLGLGQLAIGTLSDVLGRKTMLWPCLLVFSASSFFAIFCNNIITLLVLRFIQGAACAGPSSICKAILNDTFTGKQHTTMFSYLSLCWGFSIVAAPYIGGYLQYYFDWHSVFYILTAIGLILLMFVYFFLPETLHKTPDKELSIKDLFKNCIRVTSNPIFLACAAMNTIFYLFILTFSLLGPFLIQDHWKYTPVTYGHLALLIGFAWVAGGYVSRWLVKHLNQSQIIISGMTIITAIVMVNQWLVLYTHNNLYTLMLPLFFIIMVSGTIFPTTISSAMSVYNKSLGGTASSMLGVITFLLSALISFFISHIHPSSQKPWATIMLTLTIANWIFAIIYTKYKPAYSTYLNKNSS